MRFPHLILVLLLPLSACTPPEEGTPLPTRTEKTSEGGFGGLNANAKKKVPEKPELYDIKSIEQFGLTPYPKLSGDTATTELISSDAKSSLTVKFVTHESVETVKNFYTEQLDNGNAIAKVVGDDTLVEGTTKNKSQVTVIISSAEGVSKVTIRATRITQYEVE